MSRPPATKWRPRASGLGRMISCDQIAAFDRGIAEGLIPEDIRDDRDTKPYAALGTLIHFHLQDGLRCVFPRKLKVDPEDLKTCADQHFAGDLSLAAQAFAKGDSRCYSPTEAEIAAALTLFPDRGRLDAQVRAAAQKAVDCMPSLPEGVHWLAEPSVDAGSHVAPGHIDFLSSDNVWIVDLKTTSRKPTRLKQEALYQMVDYHCNTQSPKGRVIYVDSMEAQWAFKVDLDFLSDEMKELAGGIPKIVKYLRSKALFDTAMPRLLGDRCADVFCPYTRVCRDKFVPKIAGTWAAPVASPAGAMTL